MTNDLILAWCAVVGLALTLGVHMVKYAYDKGQSDQKLTQLEKTQVGFGDVHGLISSIQATMASLNKSVERLDRAVENMSRRQS